MPVQSPRLSPALAWAFAGAVSLPALTLALKYLPTGPLMALAVVTAGVAVVTGAALAAHGRGCSARHAARAWAPAYLAGVLVYLTGLELSWPQPDTAVIVTADGSGGLNSRQEIFLLFFSIGVTLALGAALDESHRGAPGRKLRSAVFASAAWIVAMLPMPILIVYGIYATSMFGNMIRFGGEVPAHLFGLLCTGAVTGLVVGAIAEGLMMHWRPGRTSVPA